MKIVKRKNELVVCFPEKVVKLKGHQDNDFFTLFTESLELNSSLSEKDKKLLIAELQKEKDIVIG